MRGVTSTFRPLVAPLLAAFLGMLVGCGTPGRNVTVDVDAAPVPHPSRLVALEVGRLLSADPAASRLAERRLTALDAEGQAALLEHAGLIPMERDPRWLNVLEENHSLGDLMPEEYLEFLLWKVSREETFYVMKAQGRLLDLARSDPGVLLARLEKGGRGTEAIAVALAMAGEARAVPPLLRRYRTARTPEERRVAAEALTLIAGEERRPRLRGAPREIARDADEVETWYGTYAGGERR